MAVTPRFVDRALHPFDAGKVDTEIVLNQAADKDRRGLGVERHADALAGKVLRRVDEPAVDYVKPCRNTREAKTGSATKGNLFAAKRLTYSELDISQASNSSRPVMRSKISRGLSRARKLSSMPSGLMSPV